MPVFLQWFSCPQQQSTNSRAARAIISLLLPEYPVCRTLPGVLPAGLSCHVGGYQCSPNTGDRVLTASHLVAEPAPKSHFRDPRNPLGTICFGLASRCSVSERKTRAHEVYQGESLGASPPGGAAGSGVRQKSGHHGQGLSASHGGPCAWDGSSNTIHVRERAPSLSIHTTWSLLRAAPRLARKV